MMPQPSFDWTEYSDSLSEFPRADKPEEACGVFGIYAPEAVFDVAKLTYFGLYALQHRGQESAGIATIDRGDIYCHKDMGLVSQVFSEEILGQLPGEIAVGHTRYSTTGSSLKENAQPVVLNTRLGKLALAHNGNLVNAVELRQHLVQREANFITSTDSEMLALTIADEVNRGKNWIQGAIAAFKICEGAYSLTIATPDGLMGARDRHGIRPLVIGVLASEDETHRRYVLSSETCGLDIIGAEYVRDVEPGELVWITDSGIPAAIGFSRESGLSYGEGLIKNRYVGRTFIQPTQSMREAGIRMKLNTLKDALQGKRIIIVDDSIVRGTTSKKIVKTLRDAGATEVHMRISSPPVTHPCFYGIDTDNQDQLIAATKSVKEIETRIGVDTLAYLSWEGMLKATQENTSHFCSACFTGDYPVAIPDEVKRSKLMLEKTKA